MTQSLSPRQDRRCAICGVYESVMPNPEEHHLIPRSLGGTETTLLCVRCHNQTEGDTSWKVSHTEDYLFVLDNKGQCIVKRWYPPADWTVETEGLLIQQLQAGPENLKKASAMFRFLSDEALKDAGQAMAQIFDMSWACLAELFREVVMRTPYGDKMDKLDAAAESFTLKRRVAQKYIAALEVAEEHELVHDMHNWTPDALLLLKTAGDPVAAIERYETMSEAGNYSLFQFKADLQKGAKPLDPPPAGHNCPDCGQWHTIKKATSADYTIHETTERVLREIDAGQGDLPF